LAGEGFWGRKAREKTWLKKQKSSLHLSPVLNYNRGMPVADAADQHVKQESHLAFTVVA